MTQQSLFDTGPRLPNRDHRKFLPFDSKPGKPYRPSNGTEGELWCERWCSRCTHYKDAGMGETCDLGISDASMLYDVNDEEYPKQWRVGIDGQPECASFWSLGISP